MSRIITAFIIGMISAVAVLWCYCGVGVAARTKVSEREQILGQRREVWATYPCAPSCTLWHTVATCSLNTFVRPCLVRLTFDAHSCTVHPCESFSHNLFYAPGLAMLLIQYFV